MIWGNQVKMSSKVPNDSTNGQTSRMICINGTRVK
ncbi:MAG: hypothetical protein RLZZ180_1138, partial [Pseudomonadota bacterium]